jgi:hypothetical protein
MKRSLCSRAPVISLLSPSLAASRRAVDQLAVWTNLQLVDKSDVEASPESMNSVFHSNFLPSLKWESIALQCPETGTILHWLSPESMSTSPSLRLGSHELLAVQDASCVTQACEEIATRVGVSASVPYLSMSHAAGRSISVHQLLGSGLPFLHFGENHDKDVDAAAEPHNNNNNNNKVTATNGCLKEIVIPANDERDRDGYTLLDQFSQASSRFGRPCTGLYQFKDASKLCLRPLPAAEADRRLPPPSLVFHTDSVDRIQELALTAATATVDVSSSPDNSTATAKIGYNGTGKGQIMVQTGDWTGLDVRFCEATKYSSMFAEAQTSLLAGGLPELQHGNGETDNGDCWVEFRANLRNPAGFLRRTKAPRIAKVPDLPYE